MVVMGEVTTAREADVVVVVVVELVTIPSRVSPALQPYLQA